MNRKKFLRRIKWKLRGLPQSEMTAMLDYFDEAISERMERGMSEEEAVAALGNPEEAAGNVLAEMPDDMRRNVKKQSGSGRVWKMIVLICASPILLSLIAAAFAAAISLVAAYLSVVISIFAAAIGCAAGALGCVALIFLTDNVGLLLGLGAGLVCAGLAILFALCGIVIVKATVKIRFICNRKRVVV